MSVTAAGLGLRLRLGFCRANFHRSGPAPTLPACLLRVTLFQSSVGIGHTALKEEDEGLFLLLVSDVPVFHMTWN